MGLLTNKKKKDGMKPRKIPMRIEPKTYFANERTFLSWLHMAVTLGSVGGFKFTLDKNRMGCDGEEDRWIPYSGAILVGVAIVFIVYALRLYLWRAGMIRERRSRSDAAVMLRGVAVTFRDGGVTDSTWH